MHKYIVGLTHQHRCEPTWQHTPVSPPITRECPPRHNSHLQEVLARHSSHLLNRPTYVQKRREYAKRRLEYMKRRLVILASHKELSDVSSKSRILGIPIHPWDTSLLHKYRSLYINIQFSHLTKTYQMCLTSLASLGYTTILGIRLFYINIGLFYEF